MLDLVWRELCALSCMKQGQDRFTDVAVFYSAAPDVLAHGDLLRERCSGAVAELLSATAALPDCCRPLRALLSAVGGRDVVPPGRFAVAHAALAASRLPRVQAARVGVVLALTWPNVAERDRVQQWFESAPEVGEVVSAVSAAMSRTADGSSSSLTVPHVDLPVVAAVQAACWSREALTKVALAGSGKDRGPF